MAGRFPTGSVESLHLIASTAGGNYPPAWTNYRRSVTIDGNAYEELEYQFLSRKRKLTIHRRLGRDDGGLRRRRFSRTLENIKSTSVKNLKVSDVIVSGQDSSISARDALLLWARRMVAGYPGVHIRDFTHSWRDGLAFLAIIHRNRPDLVDYRRARRQPARQNLEMAFNIAEREFGVTRLLDPEDVDVPEPDERSLITYVSSLYDVFPEVPSVEQSLRDNESQIKWEEYEEIAISLVAWLHDATALMLDRRFPTTYTELKTYAADFNRFRMDEVPRRQKEKYRLCNLFDELRDLRADPRWMELLIDDELQIENVNRLWDHFIHAQHEKDMAIIAEMSRLERLQRLAEKVHRDCKTSEDLLDDAERRLQEDSARLARLHPLEAKRCCDATDHVLRTVEGSVHGLFSDVQALQEGQYHQAEPLYRRVYNINERWLSLSTGLQQNVEMYVTSRPVTEERMSYRTASGSEPGTGIPASALPQSVQLLRNLQRVFDWVLSKQAELDSTGYGKDFESVREALELQKSTHEEIVSFRREISECASAKKVLSGKEAVTYSQSLTKLDTAYAQLEKSSHLRLRSLESLLAFTELATQELEWLSDKEEMEVSRDWSSQNLQLQELEDHYEQLTSELEKREAQFSAVQDHGEALIMDRHPASNTIKSVMGSMQTQWAWLLQLTGCMDVHMKQAVQHQQFYDDADEVGQWVASQTRLVTSYYNQPNISLEDGEKMLREMKEVKQTMRQYEDLIKSMLTRCRDVPPVKLRSQRLLREVRILAICSYKHMNMKVDKGEECVLLDNTRRTKWRVRNSRGVEGLIPAICFYIPPPNKDAEELAKKINNEMEALKRLWQGCQLQLKKRMIFATIEVIRTWNLAQFEAIGTAQREAIMRALREDVEKLVEEYGRQSQEAGELRDALRECEDIYSKLAQQVEEQARKPSADQQLTDELEGLLTTIDQLERRLTGVLQDALPVDVMQANSMIAKFKELERTVLLCESDVETSKQHYQLLNPAQHTAHVEQRFRLLLDKWEQMLPLLRLYSDRLDASKALLTEVQNLQELLSTHEQLLSSLSRLSTDSTVLKQTCDQLQGLQTSVQQNQSRFDGLHQDTLTLKQLVARTRPGMTRMHLDVQQLENNLDLLMTRWENLVIQATDRHANASEALANLHFYQNAYRTEEQQITGLEAGISRLPQITGRPEDAQRDIEITMKLYNEAKGRKFPMEALNRYGGKFMKEVKIYEKRIGQYVETVRGGSSLGQGSRLAGSETVVVNELNQLNQRYTKLLVELHQRLSNIKQIYDDAGIYFPYNLEPEPPGFRTFQSELRVLAPSDSTLDEADWSSTTLVTTKLTKGCDVADVFRPSHHRGVQTVVQEETAAHIPKSQFLRTLGVVDPETGRQLTLAEAADIGIFDVSSGNFVDRKTGQQLSLADAVRLGYVDAEVADELRRKSGLSDPNTGRELTTVQALQRGLIDIASGDIRDPQSGETLSPAEAAARGIISSDTASRLSRTDIITQSTNVARGYYGASNFPSTELTALPLYDAVQKGLYERNSGNIIEPVSRSQVTLEEAVNSRIVDTSHKEIFDPTANDTVALRDAIHKGVVDSRLGRYVDSKSGIRLPFDEAIERNLIRKPVPLHSALTEGLLGSGGQFRDPTDEAGRRLTLFEAIDRGILDTSFKCILDVRTGEVLSLREALDRGLINSQGLFVDPATGAALPFPAAINKGLAQVVQEDISFADRPVTNTATGERLTVAEAISRGIIDAATGRFIDQRTGRMMSLEESERSGFVDHGIAERLLARSGYRDATGHQCSILELIQRRLFDPSTGQIIDPQTGQPIPLEAAISAGVLSPADGALLLKLTSPVMSIKTVTSEIQLSRAKKTSDAEIPAKRAKSEVVGASAAVPGIMVAAPFTAGDKHHQSEDMEEYTQKIHGGTEHVKRVERQEFSGKQTEDGGYKSVFVQERKLNTLASTRAATALSGQPELPLSLSTAIKIGLLDTATGLCQDPSSSEKLSIYSALSSGILDPATAIFIDPVSNSQYNIFDAVVGGMLEETGHYTNRKTMERMTLEELIKQRIVVIIEKIRSRREFTVVSVYDTETAMNIDPEEARRRGILDSEHATYRFLETGEVISLEDAVDRGLVKICSTEPTGYVRTRSLQETKSFMITGAIDPDTKTRVDIMTALKKGIIDQANGQYIGKDVIGNEVRMTISEAIKRRLVFAGSADARTQGDKSQFTHKMKTCVVHSVVDPATGKAISVADAIQKGIIDETKGVYINTETGETVPIVEAVERGLVTADVSQSTATSADVAGKASEIVLSREVAFTLKSVIDPSTGQQLTVTEAASRGIVDLAKSEYRNPVTGEVMSLDEAIRHGLVQVQRGRPSESKETDSGEERVPSLHIDDEADAREEMVSEELSEERLTFQISGVVDPESGNVIPFNEAIQMGLVDEGSGFYIDPRTGQKTPIGEALERGLIVGQLVHKTGEKELFRSTVVATRLDEISTVFNPITNTHVSVSQAIQLGLIGRDLASYYNPATDETMTIEEAVRRGLAVSKKPSEVVSGSSLADGVKVTIDWNTGTISEYGTGRPINMNEALRQGFIDGNTAKMLEDRIIGKVEKLPAKDAPSSESVRMVIRTTETVEQPMKSITVEETVMSGADVDEFHSWLSFDAAVKLGLFNVRTGQFFNPSTGETVSLGDAVDSGFLNAQMRALVDIRTGKSVTLDKAIRKKMISEATGKIDSLKVSGEKITLDPRFLGTEQPLMLNLEDAIITGLLDVESGNFRNPVTKQMMKLGDAVSSNAVSGESVIVLNPATGDRLLLSEAIDSRLINGRTGKMTMPGDGASSADSELTLQQAVDYGLIMSIYSADSSKVVNKESGEKVTLADAIKTSLVNSDCPVVYSPQSRRRIQVSQAVNLGLVDKTSLSFTDPESRRSIPVTEAAQFGLFAVPGAPVLADTKRQRQAMTQSVFETDVATSAGARLQEEVTQWPGAARQAVPFQPIGIDSVTAASADQAASLRPAPGKGGETKTVETKTEVTPMTISVEDGVIRSSQKTTSVIEKVRTKESVIGAQVPQQDVQKKIEFGPAEAQPKASTPYSGEQFRTVPPTMTAEHPGMRQDDISDTVTEPSALSGPDQSHFYDVSSALKTARLQPEPDVRSETVRMTSDIISSRRDRDIPSDDDALRLGLVEINWETGMLKNTRSGELLSPSEALQQGLIDSHIKNLVDNRLRHARQMHSDVFTLNDALTSGLLLIPLGRIRHPTTNQRMTIEEAVDIGILDPDCSTIINPATGQVMTLTEAKQMGLIDFHSGDVKNAATGRVMTLTEMALQGYIPEHGLIRSVTAIGVRKADQTDTGGTFFMDRSTNEHTVTTTVVTRNLDKTGSQYWSATSLREALEQGLVNVDTGTFHHPKTGEGMSVTEAVQRGFLTVPAREGGDDDGIDFEEAFQRGLIDIRNNTFTDPVSGVLMPLDAAIRNGYVIIPQSGLQLRITEDEEESISQRLDESDQAQTSSDNLADTVIQFTKVTDAESSVCDIAHGLTLLDAISLRQLDAETGLFLDAKTRMQMSFAAAVGGGYIDARSGKVLDHTSSSMPDLQVALTIGILADDGRLVEPMSGKTLSLAEGIGRNLVVEVIVSPDAEVRLTRIREIFRLQVTSVLDTATNQRLSLAEAVSGRLVSTTTGEFVDSRTGTVMSLIDAYKADHVKGKLIDVVRKKKKVPTATLR